MRSLATSTYDDRPVKRLGEAGRRRSGGIGVGLGEMPGIEFEQRLDGDVEGAVAMARQGRGEGQDLDELQRRMVENALGVEAHQGGVGPVEAEDGLEPAISARQRSMSRLAASRSGCTSVIDAIAPMATPRHTTGAGAVIACGDTIGRAAALAAMETKRRRDSMVAPQWSEWGRWVESEWVA
jgi:hypothetical protein